MRRPFFLAGSASLACAALACSAAGDPDPAPLHPDENDGASSALDAAAPDAPASDAFPDAESQCSSAGWCITALPGADLAVRDIWPLPGHAFALAASALRPSTVLEWSDAAGKWTSIDDGTQNFTRGGATSIWAPNEDEVYFAMFYWNTRSGYVYHGTRPVPPATKWSWTSTALPCSAAERPRTWPDRPSLWGTSKDDVYVLSCKRVYHLNRGADAGEFPWTAEYTDDDPANPLELLGAAGTGPDDAWFVGARGKYVANSCLVVLRKTPTGYERAVDGIVSGSECASRGGVMPVDGIFSGTGASPVHAPARGHLVGTREKSGGTDAVRISAAPGGGYAVAFGRPGAPLSDVALRGVWGASEDDLWFLGTRGTSRTSFVLRGTNLWSDAGAYEFSTLARNGLPNFSPLERIRGTSVSNLWAVGDGRAYHKSTP